MPYNEKFMKCFWHEFFHDHAACVPVCGKEEDLSVAAAAAYHCEVCPCFADSDAVFAHLRCVFEYGRC